MPLCRLDFQTNFREGKWFCFNPILIQISLQIVPKGPTDNKPYRRNPYPFQEANVGSDNRLAPSRRQAIIWHYNDLTMDVIASQITSNSILYSTLCSCHHQRNIKVPRYWPFVRGIHRWLVNSTHKGPVSQKKNFHFMTSSWAMDGLLYLSEVVSLERFHYIFSALVNSAIRPIMGPSKAAVLSFSVGFAVSSSSFSHVMCLRLCRILAYILSV